MKAMGFYEYGNAGVLKEFEIADPKPAKGEVTVRVRYASLNALDLLVRNGYHGLKLEMPHIPGADVVGRIEDVGEGVTGFSKGELVIANTVIGCGKCAKCKAGNEPECSAWKTIGLQVNGSYGELVRLPASVLIKPLGGFTEEELACLPLSYSVAWRSVMNVGNLKTEDNLVVRAPSGNVGIFAIMLGHAIGANVIALTRSIDKSERLRKLGATHVIDALDGERAIKDVLEITNGNGADVIVESCGATLGESIKMAGHSARIAVFGAKAGIKAEVDIPSLYLHSITVRGIHNASKSEFEKALEYAIEKNIKPIIAKRMPISEAAEAHKMLERSEPFGKIILEHGA